MSLQITATNEPATATTTSPPLLFLDLVAQFAPIREEVLSAVSRVLDSQLFILGSEVQLLEREIASLLGAKHAVSCASGTDALILSLMGAGVGPGDEVITAPFSFIATAGAIAHVGARPVFVDIDPVSFNLNPLLIKSAITPKTRAIIPVHLFGLSADMDAILEIANEHGLTVIEDAAQAIGARYKGKCVGTLGHFGCFSFFPSKNLGGAGDGGLITTNDSHMAERLRMLRVHGSKKKYHHDILGTNSRLDALQAAILRVKLRHLDSWTAGRRNRAGRYRREFASRHCAGIIPPRVPNESYHHVYNQFTIRCKARDELKEFLRERAVPTEIYYPLCLHLQPAFTYLGHKPGALPVAEQASREALSLPVYPELSDEQQDHVIRAIADFCVAQA